MAPVGLSEFKKIIKNRVLEMAFQFFVSAFLGRYSSCKKINKSLVGAPIKKKNFFFKISRSSARCFGRCPPRLFSCYGLQGHRT